MKVDTPASKVKSCPLCASEAFLHTDRNFGGVFFWVKCDSIQCGCTVKAVKDQALALSLWNQRR